MINNPSTRPGLLGAVISYYGPGQRCNDPQPGDVFLWHGPGPIDKLIRFGQRLRFGRAHSFYNHAGMFVSPDGSVVEAGLRVMHHHIAAHDGDHYAVVRLRVDPVRNFCVRELGVRFAVTRVGESYGFLAVAFAALSMLLGTGIVVGRNGHPFCSHLVARALEHMGYTMPKEPMLVTPADLALYFGVSAPR